MKITILGCGSSGGVPRIGNYWGDCDPNDPRNRRLRVSILVEEGDTALLVDTSPDMRQQLLNCGLKNLSAVLYTHAHADHTHGIDELRSVNWIMKKPVDIYADAQTMAEIKTRFAYIFEGKNPEKFHKPSVRPHLIDGPFAIGGIKITPFSQTHGDTTALGLRFNDFAYSTDVNALDEAALAALAGVKIWVVDCIHDGPVHPTHANLDQALEWIAHVKPECAYLTHMSERVDYATLAAKLPPGIWPCHDGLVIEC